jgi:hypothetical protein
MQSPFSLTNYLHIDKEINDLEYECSKKDEEIEQTLRKQDLLIKKIQLMEKKLAIGNETFEYFLGLENIINMYLSCQYWPEIYNAYSMEYETNPVYYRLFITAMKFDFLNEKIGMDW